MFRHLFEVLQLKRGAYERPFFFSIFCPLIFLCVCRLEARQPSFRVCGEVSRTSPLGEFEAVQKQQREEMAMNQWHAINKQRLFVTIRARNMYSSRTKTLSNGKKQNDSWNCVVKRKNKSCNSIRSKQYSALFVFNRRLSKHGTSEVFFVCFVGFFFRQGGYLPGFQPQSLVLTRGILFCFVLRFIFIFLISGYDWCLLRRPALKKRRGVGLIK